MKLMNKKGMDTFQMLGGLATSIALIAITLIVTFMVITSGRSQMSEAEGIVYNNTDCIKSVTCNATGELTNSVADLPGWIPLVVICVVGAALLALVKMFKN